jgi:hypothetical protein
MGNILECVSEPRWVLLANSVLILKKSHLSVPLSRVLITVNKYASIIFILFNFLPITYSLKVFHFGRQQLG